jgi:hypothetical protein
MRAIRAMLLAGSVVPLAGQATAAEPPRLETTADLVAFCDAQGAPQAVDSGQDFCAGFIAGTGLFYLELVRADAIKPMACAQTTPTLAEARQAFVQWAKANPQYMQTKPIDGFWRAMAATYPCAN